MWRDDPFELYRTVLYVALTVYYIVIMVATAWVMFLILRGGDPRKRLLRLYLSYQLVSFRVRPLAGELVQIALWCGALALLWWLHPV